MADVTVRSISADSSTLVKVCRSCQKPFTSQQLH